MRHPPDPAEQLEADTAIRHSFLNPTPLSGKGPDEPAGGQDNSSASPHKGIRHTPTSGEPSFSAAAASGEPSFSAAAASGEPSFSAAASPAETPASQTADKPKFVPPSRRNLLAAAPQLYLTLPKELADLLKVYEEDCAKAEMLDEPYPIMPKPLQSIPEAARSLYQKGVAVPGSGRPKGSRQKLSTKFFTDLHDIWLEQGDGILRRAAFQDPMGFAAMCAKLMPQKIEVRDTTLEDMEDDKLALLIGALEQRLTGPAGQHKPGGRAGNIKTIEGRVVEPERAGPAGVLPAIRKTD